jgi:hypothetical protein
MGHLVADWSARGYGLAIRLSGCSRCKGVETSYEERHQLES